MFYLMNIVICISLVFKSLVVFAYNNNYVILWSGIIAAVCGISLNSFELISAIKENKI